MKSNRLTAITAMPANNAPYTASFTNGSNIKYPVMTPTGSERPEVKACRIFTRTDVIE